MIAYVMFGEVNRVCLQSQMLLIEGLNLFNPIVYLRKEYKAQSTLKLKHYYHEVCLQ